MIIIGTRASGLLLTIGLLLKISVESFVPWNCGRSLPLYSEKTAEGGRDTFAPSSEAEQLKAELLQLGDSTERGFEASQEDRKRAKDIIDQLEKLNPTSEPASPYYSDFTYIPGSNISGKWTLIYTDAPDITTLGKTTPGALLGRIGQECNPPYIKNVIEWKRPKWASALPFSGSDESRILQKVCTKGKASPDNPLQLELELAGLELVTAPEADSVTSKSLFDSITNQGLPVGLLQQNPVSLEGPLTAPFGKARILYLDEQLRILKTNQNFVAVNIRSDPEWF
mmetsp:Transcript_8090/g.11758  ORF Transcript_8090/g.11758 Transcript_8090/m.11758 type:complete len:283 (+) Transcript_8090:28-876(+)|eukprot:CAMPEP_0194212724 /NCGR_PEP_ID=MMETSP0156-20130528/12760_1 /TAXON_ID=33649 /ORGANISM="Thalassionema nitzschioides, Strain L26-B" /LENGTH=282 /DNA_ID=CAMNT_0038940597 /DNA_START=16 /DNA_END=864 /DNA_ORIENTATION=+